MATITVNKINLDICDKAKKDFFTHVKLAIQKIGSSNKTKVLHKLAQEEMLYIGFGISDLEKSNSTLYGTYFSSGDKISGLVSDLKHTVSSSDIGGLGSSLSRLIQANKEIDKVKTTITDTSHIQLKNLESEREKILNEIIEKIDYFDLIDIYYSLYLEALYNRAEKDKGKNKLFEAAHKVFSIMMDKILNKYYKNDNNKLKEIAIDYIFASLFTDAGKSGVISSIRRMYNEDVVEEFLNSKPIEIKEFKHSATLLTNLGLINSTENAFLNNAKGIVSNVIIDAIDTGLESFVSIAINSKYKSSIFDSRIIDDASQNKLEELLLNYKSKIILKK